jgi:DnaK suppressor protein
MDPNEMNQIKHLLVQQLDELTQRGQRTVFEISRELVREADFVDLASAESQLSEVVRLRTRERQLINKIRRALQAMEDGEYGICDACGDEISVRRLLARPVTTLCIVCKSRLEAEERRRGA